MALSELVNSVCDKYKIDFDFYDSGQKYWTIEPNYPS